MKLVLTCEHAVADIPANYQELFSRQPEIFETHEAYDPGAFDLYQYLKSLSDFSKSQLVGRLLVETNRSLGNKKLFSRFTSVLNDSEKLDILNSYYHPYRLRIENRIRRYLEGNEEVLHISVHTFTPVLNDVKRNVDIGLLYDPKRTDEKRFCGEFKEELLLQMPGLKVRFNYPYLGKADGFTTYLRKIFRENYLGIEIEVNQSLVHDNVMGFEIKKSIFTSLKKLTEK
ncbi:N-formylglutamate amidohydrolase [Gramella sp. KN1008]|uniref:N-formylglutamate amidohydrolase n=1 Tax=Gramella sp. KN1008 TaxID=2529298 RepID=UPI00103AF0F4|nr:N-formylglutamate amidohydrolase [Gramella sp. KN1008]TBW29150.1 N-formylglutamate amidohydrolase [Gramella sp. KN1008]